MRKACLTLLLAGVLLLFIPVAYAGNPISNLEVVHNLPETIVAGNSYEVEISFLSIARESLPVVVELNVTCEEAPLGEGEILLDEARLNDVYLGFEEILPGYFISEEGTMLPLSTNSLTMTISSVVNLMPGTYSFTISLFSESITIPTPPGPPHPPPGEPEEPEEPTEPEEHEEPEVPEEPEEPEEPGPPPEEPPEEPEEPEVPPKPPEIHITALWYDLEGNKTVELVVVLENMGDLPGTENLTLRVDGLVWERRSVYVEPGDPSLTIFTLRGLRPGTHTFSVDGHQGSFEIPAPPPEEKPSNPIPYIIILLDVVLLIVIIVLKSHIEALVKVRRLI